jgi:hypothetical protein
MQLRPLRGPPAPLTGHDLKAAAMWPNNYRLDDTALAYAVRQLC